MFIQLLGFGGLLTGVWSLEFLFASTEYLSAIVTQAVSILGSVEYFAQALLSLEQFQMDGAPHIY